ncbi:DUF624 domain-containing protein [Streptomyces rugosispiralis]|uniref:DUF624 domain-containing protein n=1 Tax=Streptomyces rugosispiralis TaxID=2967341 RepID=A0ABT1UYX0_9ACTN|nr:DUF624 domain-containing protein [Streptomyces rugosispiralis]MCQ8190252.1 DUF624 domain-containing protein [Streptomyces rugosispiralis]
MNQPSHRALWAGPAYAGLDTVCRYLLLSLLWTIGTALVITAPAAATALVATVHGWARGDQSPVCPTFLSHLRRSARTSTAALAALAPVAALLVLNSAVVPHMGQQRPYATVALTAVAVPFLVFATNLIPALAGAPRGVRDAYRETVDSIVRHPGAAGLTTGTALLAVCCIYIQPVGALLIAAPAARLVITAHGHRSTWSATTSQGE